MTDGDLWRDRNKVFVAGLPLHVDDDGLYDKFKPFGDMHQSKVVYDPKTGRSRGFGFVTFRDYTHALDAVDQMNQTKWDSRTLNVRFLQPKTTTGGPIFTPSNVIRDRPDGCTTVYVGNLAYDITDQVLHKVFDKCGTIRAIRFAEHIQTHEFRGFGYVQFHDESACEAALQLNGMVVMGRPMVLDYGTRDEGYTQARAQLQQKLKKGLCHKFQTNSCTRGEACKFAHVLQDQDAEAMVPVVERPVEEGTRVAEGPRDVEAQAPVCINFQKGKCKRGNTCKFQHLHGHGKVENNVKDEHDVPVCQNYQKGKCKRGEACRFRHLAALSEQKDAGPPVRVAMPVAAVAQVAVCRNFQTNSCLRGTSCRFAHTEGVQVAEAAVEEVSQYQKRFQSVCYNWQRTTSCQRGDKCPFQHDKALTVQDEDVDGEKKLKKVKKDKKRRNLDKCESDDYDVDKKPKKRKKDKKERKHKQCPEED